MTAGRRAGGADALAARWAAELGEGPGTPTPLRDAAGWLLDALDAGADATRRAGADAGAALVAAGFTDPAALEATLAVLPGEGPALAGAVAAGYARALAEHARRDQQRADAAVHAAAEQVRRTSERRFEAAFAHAASGIAIIAIGGIVVEVNEAFCTLFGRRPGAFVGHNVHDFARLEEAPDSRVEVKRLLAGELDRVRFERSYLHRDGSTVRVEILMSLVRSPEGVPRYVVCLLDDVGERYRLQERLRHQAEHDPLTGLVNRGVFAERLQAALDGDGDAVGLLSLDLDGFKGVNDTLGHHAGDALLQAVAQRLERVAAPHLAARLGGDEFAVLTRGEDGAGLRALAERLLAALGEPFAVDGQRVLVTASIGIVAGAGPAGADRSAGALLTAADTTLYRAKAAGRDRCAEFDAVEHRRAIGRFELAARMGDALAAGEFDVVYQPLVRLSDVRTVGVEALVRWRPDTGPALTPDRFVPIAEETGMIVPLGLWVLERACRDARGWAADTLLSVNVAARQVREPGFVTDLERVLADTGWPAQRLQVELTETDLMGGAATLETLHAIAARGVRIAIDDFGTGYSNLAYLRRLPVHTLKLAAPFVRDIAVDELDADIAALLVRLGHGLDMTVVAEAVETAEQCDRLRELGCDVGQGYLFAPPLPAGELATRLR